MIHVHRGSYASAEVVRQEYIQDGAVCSAIDTLIAGCEYAFTVTYK